MLIDIKAVADRHNLTRVYPKDSTIIYRSYEFKPLSEKDNLNTCWQDKMIEYVTIYPYLDGTHMVRYYIIVSSKDTALWYTAHMANLNNFADELTDICNGNAK
jgi:hypothetical protein